jgi:hypothetical protein
MFYRWFTGITIINWPLRKIVTIFTTITTIWKPGFIVVEYKQFDLKSPKAQFRIYYKFAT